MSDNDSTGLPASIQAAWGLRERPGRGPRPGLSLTRIVEAAVDVADAEGLHAVSMKRVAGHLHSAPMSLYRYVAAKDELLVLMVDSALGAPPTVAPEKGWRAGLSQWAHGALASYRRHTWVLRVPISAPPATPQSVAWMEQGLRALRETGLTEQEKLSSVLLLSGYVRNVATLEADITEAAAKAGATPAQALAGYGRMLARLVDPNLLPAVSAAIASGALDDDVDHLRDEFGFGLDRVLDGIDALVHARG